MSTHTDSTETVTLVSSEGDQFTVPAEVAQQSITIKNTVEDTDDGTIDPVPCPGISSAILQKCIDYCTENQGAAPLNEEDHYRQFTEWETEFCNVERPVLFGMLEAANYLEIEAMLNLTCRAVAELLKNAKGDEEIKEIWGVPDDEPAAVPAPEEEAPDPAPMDTT
jgi:S-phase kinase-associated protein 1